jgi:outer membrane protein OmpA-like peptidoglycan-associated protein
MTKRLFIILFIFLSGFVFSTSFNYSTALVNAPNAEVLQSMGYYLAINHAHSFSSNIYDGREIGEEDLNFNFGYHFPMDSGLFRLNFEFGVSVFSMFSKISGQNLIAGNLKLQFIEDASDKDYKGNYDFDKNPVYKFVPSVAIGIKNLSGEKYITSVGTPTFTDESGSLSSPAEGQYNLSHNYNNSFYLALSKKFYLGNSFIQGHLGWGSGTFMGIKEVDRNVGVVYGISTTIFPINKLSPLKIMFDYDGNKYSLGVQLVYNNSQLLDIAKDEKTRKFIPGFVVNLAVTDIDEAIHQYEDAGWSPKIEFGLGITNNAYLSYAGAPAKRRIKKKVKPKKKVTKKKTTPKKKVVKREKKKAKKKMTPEELRAVAKKRALEARRKASEARRRAIAAQQPAAQPKVKKEDIQKSLSESVRKTIQFIEEADTVKFIPKSVRFKKDSTDLSPIAYKALNEIGKYLKDNPNIKIEIQGYSDNTGEKSKNIEISKNQAKKIKNYLVKKFGLDPSRLATKGFGPAHPRFDNSTTIGRMKNKRVEFVIIQ